MDHLEMCGGNVAHHAMNEGQNRPGLFVPKPLTIFIEKRYMLSIVGQNTGIRNSRVTNVASNVATDAYAVLNTRLGMNVEPIPIDAKQSVNQPGVFSVLWHYAPQCVEALVLPYLAQCRIVDEGLFFPCSLSVQSAFGNQDVQMVIDLQVLPIRMQHHHDAWFSFQDFAQR